MLPPSLNVKGLNLIFNRLSITRGAEYIEYQSGAMTKEGLNLIFNLMTNNNQGC